MGNILTAETDKNLMLSHENNQWALESVNGTLTDTHPQRDVAYPVPLNKSVPAIGGLQRLLARGGGL